MVLTPSHPQHQKDSSSSNQLTGEITNTVNESLVSQSIHPSGGQGKTGTNVVELEVEERGKIMQPVSFDDYDKAGDDDNGGDVEDVDIDGGDDVGAGYATMMMIRAMQYNSIQCNALQSWWSGAARSWNESTLWWAAPTQQVDRWTHIIIFLLILLIIITLMILPFNMTLIIIIMMILIVFLGGHPQPSGRSQVSGQINYVFLTTLHCTFCCGAFMYHPWYLVRLFCKIFPVQSLQRCSKQI